MQVYQNNSGQSNVEAFEIGQTYILVKFFGTAKVYKYSYSSAGVDNVEIMKRLAIQGSGLNSFINKNVKSMYER